MGLKVLECGKMTLLCAFCPLVLSLKISLLGYKAYLAHPAHQKTDTKKEGRASVGAKAQCLVLQPTAPPHALSEPTYGFTTTEPTRSEAPRDGLGYLSPCLGCGMPGELGHVNSGCVCEKVSRKD